MEVGDLRPKPVILLCHAPSLVPCFLSQMVRTFHVTSSCPQAGKEPVRECTPKGCKFCGPFQVDLGFKEKPERRMPQVQTQYLTG